MNDLGKAERISNRDDDARIAVDGDREAPDSAELAAAQNSPAASNRGNHTQSGQNEVAGSKSGKTKRTKSSKRCATHRSVEISSLCDLTEGYFARY